ncbi:hypothetical protein DGo_PB0129 (plasmid) [Deinococcus gobiensis I-0]|uniref:Uncharacterized protein n=1 Tax=Deinococcus gobiensis (strain DSM 21396 / JCM 16679 / CGMCC 1.7299 / I-0) TaxID=745776 RepID=H8H1K1_DEIGI|nr:hypothetical protein DGo_PB0129 [Deinococcus gobiensis I-0]
MGGEQLNAPAKARTWGIVLYSRRYKDLDYFIIGFGLKRFRVF